MSKEPLFGDKKISTMMKSYIRWGCLLSLASLLNCLCRLKPLGFFSVIPGTRTGYIPTDDLKINNEGNVVLTINNNVYGRSTVNFLVQNDLLERDF